MTAPPHRELPLFRPPAEASSLLLRVAEGCPHNTCSFCGMYRGIRYRVRPLPEIDAELRARRGAHAARRAFLADGDAMNLPATRLEAVLRLLRAACPGLTRVGAYANGRSILGHPAGALRRLRKLGLHTLYLGLESGDPATLARCGKRDTVEEMVAAGLAAQACGLRMSVMVLVGLAGAAGSAAHARATAGALNRMQPRLLSALRVIPVPGTPLYEEAAAGSFRMLSEREAVAELRSLLAGLTLRATVFRADHASNVVPLEGRLPRDRARLVAGLDAMLRDGGLDRRGPGPLPPTL